MIAHETTVGRLAEKKYRVRTETGWSSCEMGIRHSGLGMQRREWICRCVGCNRLETFRLLELPLLCMCSCLCGFVRVFLLALLYDLLFARIKSIQFAKSKIMFFSLLLCLSRLSDYRTFPAYRFLPTASLLANRITPTAPPHHFPPTASLLAYRFLPTATRQSLPSFRSPSCHPLQNCCRTLPFLPTAPIYRLLYICLYLYH